MSWKGLVLVLGVFVRVLQRHHVVESFGSSAYTRRRQLLPTFLSSTFSTITAPLIEVKEEIGCGSYGTVYRLEIAGGNYVGKRAWGRSDQEKFSSCQTDDEIDDKVKRCRTYFEVETHCLNKLPQHASLPSFYGVQTSSDGQDWMVFECINDCDCTLTRTLQDWLEQEQRDRRQEPGPHHLTTVSIALGLGASTSLTQVLDVLMEDLLECLSHLHTHQIVHRDVKPSNLLVTGERVIISGDDGSSSKSHLVLIDFGSAADLDTAGLLKKNIGISERVAVSPIYAAPELFIDASRRQEALTFDCFSAALLFCQLLFQLCDERNDAGFHQQLQAANCDLNLWLQAILQAKVSSSGLDDALTVLQERPGLWNLLQQMLQPEPRNRISSHDALLQWRKIRRLQIDVPDVDGAYLREVIESLDTCVVETLPALRPLQFVATFRRNQPLGIILSEAQGEDDDDTNSDNETVDDTQILWKLATVGAILGEVFVRGVVEGGQAEAMGIFEIGDRLQGVGELPLTEGGFEKAVAMLQDQPESSKYVTLHFDRKSALTNGALTAETLIDHPAQVVDQGAWSLQGRRKAQEDSFLLHQLHDTRQRSIVLAGVMDGHLGAAASSFVRDKLPEIFVAEMLKRQEEDDIQYVLEQSWNQVCDAYRFECMSESCSAEYDPREGILMANTGSADYVAGTTSTLLALDLQTSHLAFLNCGDSRALAVGADGAIRFRTVDHKPSTELKRFEVGCKQSLEYSRPECVLSRWVVPVGDYNYAVSRSLEGSFATSKGIVSTPDVSFVRAERGLIAVAATDGFWEVIDSEEAAGILVHLRYKQGMSAGDAAKTLCSRALEKGSTDNVSVVVLYLED